MEVTDRPHWNYALKQHKFLLASKAKPVRFQVLLIPHNLLQCWLKPRWTLSWSASDGQEVRPGPVLTLESLLVKYIFFNWQYYNASCFTVTSSRFDSLNNENELPVTSPGYDQFLWQLRSNKNVMSIILAACCWKAEEQALPVVRVAVAIMVKSTFESLQVRCCREPMCGVDTLSSGCIGDDMIPGLLFLWIASIYMYYSVVL